MNKVSEIMTKEVEFCSPNDSVATAAQKMRNIDCGSLPICEGKTVVGIITDRDIVLNVVADGKDSTSVTCQECMTTSVISCSPDTDVHECARMMAENQIRRIPVVQNGELVGICAIGDLATINIFVNESGDALSRISEPHSANH
ncbi:CBS domain-containing protein [Paenibacillus senegalensis]|uniref:CBS domain-containing protein n=1 Tax=Paenibacillus senegalensis TaxID=1465766 RepID=UPI000287DDFC|nr:CBS domain-containing protein [Paenibacillus senegalensis]